MRINWLKIIGNTGITFFTSLTALNFAVGQTLPQQEIIFAAVVIGAIQGGLAFFTGLRNQATEPKKKKVASSDILVL